MQTSDYGVTMIQLTQIFTKIYVHCVDKNKF